MNQRFCGMQFGSLHRVAWGMVMPFLVVCLAFLSPFAGAQPVYKFGVVPQFEPRKLASIWVPILAELERRTGFKLVMVGAARIPDFEGEFEAGHYDFAYMNPYHSLIAARTQKYVPLVRDGGKKLFGILVTAKDGPIKGIKDLEGKSIAFPAPNAIGASLLMRADLEHLHKLVFTPVWAQTHTSAYLNAALGKVAAAGGVMSTLLQQPPSVRDKLQVIYETRRIAPHPVMAHGRVPAADREKLRQAFLDLGTTPEGRALLSPVPISQIVAASAEDYEEITGWGLEQYYVQGGD
ncbi:phosphate/phosphite/phosphonate ABC transporter substrate-binding protein [Candidatus Symbiobacter mobilis]|uniref:Phosphonate transporter substrate-binding protein n=1 Tax=Candidatus Symbiobacter mobilis CR TaxID=946483 RepID=U5NB39_9BURK|nr:phosphate/phosphite/phosphonate ABC transporter substrate-binding protein [Candidatus Symbiobacter mobilis]AGX88530.1 phosphonate transporter substrate-binding protein [Candidatus Symbiobacter mobilis CR]